MGDFPGVNKKIARDIIADEIINKGSIRIKVFGGSMSPTIRANSKIKIINSKQVKVGSIICYKTRSWFLIHRITGMNNKTGLITVEGDSKDSVVHKINKSDIIGVVEENMYNKIMHVVSKVERSLNIRP